MVEVPAIDDADDDAAVSSSSDSSNNNEEMLRKLLKPAPTLHDIRNILIHYYYDNSNNNNNNNNAEKDVHIIQQLDSYDDCNYQVQINDNIYLLKITNGLESQNYINTLLSSSSSSSSQQSIIEFQHSIMNALYDNHIGTTVPVKPIRYDPPTTTNDVNDNDNDISSIIKSSTSQYRNGYIILHKLPVVSKSYKSPYYYLAIRLYQWVYGQPMASISHPHRISLHTIIHVGQQLGKIHHILDKTLPSSSSSSLSSLKLPQHRYHQWDTKNTYDLLSFTQYITNEQRQSMIISIINTFHHEILTTPTTSKKDGTATTTVADNFRRGIIMGDYNDANIILHPETLEFSGVIDFGDSLESWRVLDITIAMAYAGLTTYAKNQHASISAMAAMLRGYHSIYPLTSIEREHILLLIVCRLACSVTLGAYSIQQNPENVEYLSLHSKPAWDALELLWGYDIDRRHEMKHVLNHVFDQACSYNNTDITTATNEIPQSFDLAFPDPSIVDPFGSIRMK